MQGRTRLALLPLAAASALVAAMAATGPVHATGTTITVTGFNDGPGTCPDAAHCTTLRAAIGAANGLSGATVVLPAGTYTLSQPGDFTSLEITSSMTVQGAGAGTTTVQGACNTGQAWSGRLFTVNGDGPTTVAINGLTLTGGRVTDSDNGDGSNDGGAVLVLSQDGLALNHDVVTGNEAIGNGGGVAVDNAGASLTVLDTIVKNNTAGSSATSCGPQEIVTPTLSFSNGGGVFAQGMATMTGSSVAGNVAGGDGGGIFLEPPSGATDTLTRMFVHDNSAMGLLEQVDAGGGGIYDELVPGSRVVLGQSTLSHNHAAHGNGGGTYEDGNAVAPEVANRTAVSGPAQVTVTATTFNGNDAALLGGAMYLHSAVQAALTNDTLNGNSAANGGGVAIGEAVLGRLALESDTVDGNTATAGLGGGLDLPDGAGTVHNSIVAVNTGIPQVTLATLGSNCALGTGTLTSLGYNIADDTTCALLATGDQQPPHAVPALGPLQANGGPVDGATGDTSPTLTQALTLGSTALDAGDPNNYPATDERGVTRPQTAPSSLLGLGVPKVARVAARIASAPRADIGAYEAQAAVATTPPPSSPVPLGGVQGVISVPNTGGGPDAGPAGAALLLASALLTATAAVVVSRRRR
ncbi:MAG TPA: choice-of-anchor Q domain-containing protein [Candidatus Angelobacter sp.]|jgi:hypothetical protein|nr:choice-of-anchor Q domain-containing protein [Candidatus Angelobacter sp.]